MAHPRISQYVPPNINPAQAAIAYGHRALPKLNEELQSEYLLIRCKALMALSDLVHDPENVFVAINTGFMKNLKKLLEDINDFVRLKTTEVLYIMASHNVGRQSILDQDVIPSLSFLMDDPSPDCRKNLFMVFKYLAQLPSGAQGIINNGLIPSLVWKLQQESEENQALLLDTLASCLMVDATAALNTHVVIFLKEKLDSLNSKIRVKAARTLAAISIPLEGKKQVCQYEVIPILVKLLQDQVMKVQANAAGVLMFATVITEGKYAALDANAIYPLLNLLDSPLTEARLNAVKTLTMLAEAPEGRKILRDSLATFRTLESDDSISVKRAAKIAIKVIEWTP
ncbi:radial spoke head 14 homolog [Sorex araneus]|uniref:radial spoke head 14 homolog n=1 Tax=Sorex araneus TaxID=42254 RepID=UPI002433AEC0|nr:radial spoke head 14 homolog [Sorex araneus]